MRDDPKAPPLPEGDYNLLFLFLIFEGTIIAKLSQNPRTKEHRLTYMLGPLKKDKLHSSVSAEEINKIIINAENEVLYGTVMFLLFFKLTF